MNEWFPVFALTILWLIMVAGVALSVYFIYRAVRAAWDEVFGDD